MLYCTSIFLCFLSLLSQLNLRPLSFLCIILGLIFCSGDITSSSWLVNDNSGYSSKFLKKRQVSCDFYFSFLSVEMIRPFP